MNNQPHLPERTLLYIDMAYTADFVIKRNQQQFFESRHSNGYFQKLWGVHPLADIGAGKALHQIRFIRFSPRQLIIEGVAQLFRWPKILLPLNLIFSQYCFLRLCTKAVKRNNISLIAATDCLYSGLFGVWLKKICKKPLVVFLYMNLDEVYEDTGKVSMPRLIPWRWLEKKIIRYVLKRADLVAGGNANNMRFGLNNGAAKEKAVVLPVSKNMYHGHLIAPEKRQGIDDTLIQWGIPPGKTYLLFLGRHHKVKRPEDAIKAMKLVIENESGVIGLLAGDGPLRSELETLVTSFGLQDKILFLGNVDQESLSKIIPRCITISPLTGMALIECGLGGSPIVAYRRDWQPDFINDGEDGFIVDFRDYEALGKRALQLVRDSALRSLFSKRIREKSLAYADAGQLYRHEHAVYDALFNRTEVRNVW